MRLHPIPERAKVRVSYQCDPKEHTMPPTTDSLCPRCHQPGNPANFGATCDPCKTALNARTIDLRDAETTNQAAAAAARREQYTR